MITEEQRHQRKNSIGSSDVPIIMGYSGYSTPYQLYLEKVGLITGEREETEAQFWGNALEKTIAEHYSKKSTLEITCPDTIYHPVYEFMHANLDAYIPSLNAVLEIKCSDKYQRDNWGESGTDNIPMTYLVQVAYQCIVADAAFGDIAVLIGGNEYREYRYHRDAQLENLILAACMEFWSCVTQRKEPDSITIEDSRLKYKEARKNASIAANGSIHDKINTLRKLKEKARQLDLVEKDCKFHIMEYMMHNEILTDEHDNIVATFKSNAKKNRVFLLKGAK